MTLLAGGAVAVAILLASALAYVTIAPRAARPGRRLAERPRRRARRRRPAPGRLRSRLRPAGRRHRRRSGTADFYEGLVTPDGTRVPPRGAAAPPVDERARDVAAGRRGAVLADAEIAGEPVRAARRRRWRAAARSRSPAPCARRARCCTACASSSCSSRRAASPARRCSAASWPAAPPSRCAASSAPPSTCRSRRTSAGASTPPAPTSCHAWPRRFNDMLGALERSMTAQRQLVADASHELRTPVTSLRTNLEVLQANPDLDAARRAELLAPRHRADRGAHRAR